MSESVHKSVQNIKGIRLLATATGLLAGIGTGYLVCYFIDALAEPPMYYWGLMDLLLPFAVLGMIALLLWIRKPLSTRDAIVFVVYFWVPFLFLYLVTHFLYWAPKI